MSKPPNLAEDMANQILGLATHLLGQGLKIAGQAIEQHGGKVLDAVDAVLVGLINTDDSPVSGEAQRPARVTVEELTDDPELVGWIWQDRDGDRYRLRNGRWEVSAEGGAANCWEKIGPFRESYLFRYGPYVRMERDSLNTMADQIDQAVADWERREDERAARKQQYAQEALQPTENGEPEPIAYEEGKPVYLTKCGVCRGVLMVHRDPKDGGWICQPCASVAGWGGEPLITIGYRVHGAFL